MFAGVRRVKCCSGNSSHGSEITKIAKAAASLSAIHFQIPTDSTTIVLLFTACRIKPLCELSTSGQLYSNTTLPILS
jgi:hypothetical protein